MTVISDALNTSCTCSPSSASNSSRNHALCTASNDYVSSCPVSSMLDSGNFSQVTPSQWWLLLRHKDSIVLFFYIIHCKLGHYPSLDRIGICGGGGNTWQPTLQPSQKACVQCQDDALWPDVWPGDGPWHLCYSLRLAVPPPPCSLWHGCKGCRVYYGGDCQQNKPGQHYALSPWITQSPCMSATTMCQESPWSHADMVTAVP